MQKNSSRMDEVESDQECQCLVFSPCISEVDAADVVDAVFSQTLTRMVISLVKKLRILTVTNLP